MKTPKHGIEVKYNKGRIIRLLSYAVYSNGNCQVSHATTADLRRNGHDISALLTREQETSGMAII